MIYPSADKLESWGSKYSLVVLAAKRAKQLKGGAIPMIQTDSRNPLTIALEEIAAGKIECRVPDNDIIPTLTQEPEVAALLGIPSEELAEEAAEMAEIEAGAAAAVGEEVSILGLDEEETEEDEVEALDGVIRVPDDEEENDEIAAGIDLEESDEKTPDDDLDELPVDDEDEEAEDE